MIANKVEVKKILFVPEGYLDLEGTSIFTRIPKGTLRKYLHSEPERFLVNGRVNRKRPSVCRVGKRILISVDAIHAFLKTKEMVPASLNRSFGGH